VTFASLYTCALVAAGTFWEKIAISGHGADSRYTKWFELLCIRILAEGGEFPVRKLTRATNGQSSAEETDATSAKMLTLPQCKLVAMDVVPGVNANLAFYSRWAASDDNFSKYGENCILVPQTTNLPVVDCANVPHPETGPRGFQVTVSSSHPISAGEIRKILSELFPHEVETKANKVKKASPMAKTLATMDLYFVVPVSRATAFTRQNFKHDSQETKDCEGLHERVNQYVVAIEVHHVDKFLSLYQECVDRIVANAGVAMLNPLKRPRNEESYLQFPSADVNASHKVNGSASGVMTDLG
jgi:hypothetical protein